MKAVGFIFARGGSKGLPGKNIRLLGDKPLIAWSIDHARSIDRIDRIIVSTDSEEIAAVAREFGAEVPFIRPASLAGDDTPEWLAWRHGLDFLHRTSGTLPDAMVSIPTTAPLRFSIDIENCLNEFEKGGADVVITVTDPHRNPYFNMVKEDREGTVSLVNASKLNIANRQEAPALFDMATVCYVVDPLFVKTHDSIFAGRVKAVYVPRERAIDIDSLLDFQIAESLLNLREKRL